MTEYRKVFIDTAPFIYYIEENRDDPQYFDTIKSFLEKCYDNEVPLVTSVITLEEYCVLPYRNMELGSIDIFKKFLKTIGVEIISIDEIVAEKAAQIRSEYVHFKSMDALQLAVACLKGCDLFFTNDRQLKQFKEIQVLTIAELKERAND